MNQQLWLKLILILSITLLALTMGHEKLALNKSYRWFAPVKLPYSPQSSADSASFWEATLNGNSRQIGKEKKEQLKALGLAHIYTPSGLHLSLILNPLFFFLRSTLIKSILLGCLFLASSLFLPAWMAIKRVLEIKLSQTLLKPLGVQNHHTFLAVMFLDMAFGTYQEGTLSFCFSFLFLGFLYARMNFLLSAWWFFIGQLIINVFLEQNFFITNIIFTPLLTLLFSSIFPLFLILRVIPPLHWVGEAISGYYLDIVELIYKLSSFIPKVEATPFLIVILFLILYQRPKLVLASLIFFSCCLNNNENAYQTNYLNRKYYYVSSENEKCKKEGGFEKCSYRSRSTKEAL